MAVCLLRAEVLVCVWVCVCICECVCIAALPELRAWLRALLKPVYSGCVGEQSGGGPLKAADQTVCRFVVVIVSFVEFQCSGCRCVDFCVTELFMF